MSWDAHLIEADADPDEFHGFGWNYTHNTNGMIAAAIEAAGGEPVPMCGGSLGFAIGPEWWARLHGATGLDGAVFLRSILTEFDRDPDRYRAMNPDNGWGDMDSLRTTLREMADAVHADEPTRWVVNG